MIKNFLMKSLGLVPKPTNSLLQNLSETKRPSEKVDPVIEETLEEDDDDIEVTDDLIDEINNKSKSLIVKTFASDSFLTAINQAYTKIDNSDKNEKFYTFLKEGLNLLKLFAENSDRVILYESAQKFVEASKLKKVEPDPYFFLSYIFYLIRDKASALKYFQTVKFINPRYPGLDVLKTQILAK